MKPLAGIRVVDLSHAVSGPFCTYQLALLGADVIKVERPRGGDPLRQYTEHAGAPGMSTPFITINAGKRSVVLDLKTEQGIAALKELVRTSDVLVENYRPGVTEAMGIDAETVQAERPSLIYCSITGFGPDGELRTRTAYDHIIQAMSGLMSVNGEPDGEPVKLGVPISDTFAGYMAAFAIVTALLQQRANGGQGQRISISMLDASLVLLNQSIVTYLHSGQEPVRRGNQGFRLVATADTFPTADGYLTIGANEQPQFEKLCAVLDAEELLSDPRFADHRARADHAVELRAALADLFATRRGEDVEEALAAVQVPVAKVRTVPEILAHPDVRDGSLLERTTAGGIADELTVVGAGFRFAHDGPAVSGPVPTLGEHTAEVLAELRSARQPIEVTP